MPAVRVTFGVSQRLLVDYLEISFQKFWTMTLWSHLGLPSTIGSLVSGRLALIKLL